ncbi:hypothetical protein DCCM_2458 [Desulfocucumis palustris]|uniref:HTH cro/C1-type domain-containing protein n=1 Tax=Desulfocucumis palustris TaxID=1898651 RepID=A0A2L2XAR2_9FIRM|nr:helix-turn-helix domain-containing protein [Desulfocucumis palustris]GBF33357.1 hypothetical protein DCCM_2458 [Desulfocucumis palustris]
MDYPKTSNSVIAGNDPASKWEEAKRKFIEAYSQYNKPLSPGEKRKYVNRQRILLRICNMRYGNVEIIPGKSGHAEDIEYHKCETIMFKLFRAAAAMLHKDKPDPEERVKEAMEFLNWRIANPYSDINKLLEYTHDYERYKWISIEAIYRLMGVTEGERQILEDMRQQWKIKAELKRAWKNARRRRIARAQVAKQAKLAKRKERAQRLSAKGLSTREIAEIMGISKSTISRWLREVSEQPKATSNNREEIIRLREEGLSQQEIASRFGISQSTVSRVLRNK